MSQRINICPIGFVEEEILAHIVDCIEKRCGVGCVVSSRMETPQYAYDDKRCQYNSKLILKHMITCCPEGSLGFMGVTHLDLYVPILKYVFGLSQVEGKCSVISIHRLRPQFYELPPDPSLLRARIEKTALHELGHAIGLTHCRNRHCVMYSSTKIEHTDTKEPTFCLTCLELFKWLIKKM